MNPQEVRAILSICLLAAYSDNEKHDRERDQIRQVANALGQHEQINLPGLYQDVLLRRVQLADVVGQLSSAESREMAYEMAVCVCDADGTTSDKEAAFLAQLKSALALGQGTVESHAQVIASAPLHSFDEPIIIEEPTDPAGTAGTAGTASPAPHPTAADSLGNASTQTKTSTLSNAEIDKKILSASITNGAIELLPENLATLAIIPLQMRLVYQIGQTYGYELDKGHIKDLLAALGVGLTSQYLEQAGRKLLGRVLGGGIFGGIGKQAVSSGMSFASTYALGHVASQYYAGGRTLSTQMLKSAYEQIMQDGRSLQTQYLPQIQDTARNLNTAKILDMVRGR